MKYFRQYIIIIYLSIISPFTLPAQLVQDFRVNHVPATLNLLYPSVAVDAQGNFNIVWTNLRREKGSNRTLFNIYCQRYNYNAEALGKNFRVNLNPDTANMPSIAAQSSGRFAVCWRELNGMYPNIYFRLFNSEGVPLISPLKINDSITGQFSVPAVGVDLCGKYTVAWKQRRGIEPAYKIFYQQFDSLGNKHGNNVRVDDYDNSNKERPAITIRKDNSFIITWDDQRIPGANPHIFMQIFDPGGNPIGANQRVSEITDPLDMHIVSKISSDSTGNFIVTWTDSRGIFPESRKYAQAYNKYGEKIGNNFRLLEIIDAVGNVTVKREDGKYLFGTSFEQSFNVHRGIIQRYNSSNVKIDGIYNLSTQATGNTQFYEDAKIFGDKIISVWLDNRDGPSNVYCNIRSFQNPDSIISSINSNTGTIPESFQLFQNYPNPFNPETKIKFSLPQSGIVSLVVYDISGREVVKLVNEKLSTGTYEYSFDGSGLSSGVYFYQMESGSFIQTKRMVLIK
jgi:hypothetical protein